MARCARVDRLPMSSPDDTTAIEHLLATDDIQASNIVAVLGKTEGNGCVNDFSRGFAVKTLQALLRQHLPESSSNAIPLIMSGGTEGGLSPHWIVLSTTETQESITAEPRLAFANSITRTLSPSEIGGVEQVQLVQAAVTKAMANAHITSTEDVHFVQVKCPLLTSERVAQVHGDVTTKDTLESMALSRGASALGVALALGEIQSLDSSQICSDWSMWSSRASCSAGIELMSCEVVVMGESYDWNGELRIAHTVMQDAIDAPAILDMLESRSVSTRDHTCNANIVALLAKAEASHDGLIRGARHTMLNDSDISSTRHARGFVGGLLAGLVGHTELFVSGGAEHQGPDGAGPVAMIYR